MALKTTKLKKWCPAPWKASLDNNNKTINLDGPIRHTGELLFVFFCSGKINNKDKQKSDT